MKAALITGIPVGHAQANVWNTIQQNQMELQEKI
jgi:hypothetical protein